MVRWQVFNGISSTDAHDRAIVQLPPDTRVQALRFIDDQDLLVAYTNNGELRKTWIDTALINEATFYIASIPYQPAISGTDGPTYARVEHKPRSSAQKQEMTCDFSNPQVLQRFQRHAFPMKAAWAPSTLELNGREGRRAICIFSKDRSHFRVFGLDQRPENGEVFDTGHASEDESDLEDSMQVET